VREQRTILLRKIGLASDHERAIDSALPTREADNESQHANFFEASDAHFARGRHQAGVAIMSAQDRLLREIAATLALTVVLMFAALSVPVAYAQAMPQVRSQGSVDFVTGGISKDESDAMKQASAEYPLTVEFASSGPLPTEQGTAGYYTAGATVDIRDSQGRSVLNTKADGPFLLVRLPAGKYTIETEWNGVRKQANVDLSGNARRHVVFDYARGAQ
jgi:hypothetical protein